HGATGGSPPPAAFDRESARELFDSGVLDLAPAVEAVWGGSAAGGRGNGSGLPPVGAAEAPQGPEVAEAEVSEAVRVEEPPEALEPEPAYAFEEAQEIEPQAAAPPAPEAEEPGAAEAREREEPETEDAQEAPAAPAVADPAPEPRKPEAAPELESAAGPPPATAADLAALEAAMVSAPDREALSRLALRIARLYACAAATFTVRGGMIHGVLAASDAGERQVDGILVPCGVDCILSGPATWGEPFRGNPPRTGLDGSLLAALGRSSAREVAIFPIQIGEKVVNLLYVDNGPNPLGETACAALATLCNCVAGAYEQLIVAIRSQHC
ncbi:MAG: hypothetical protein V3U03_04335, partial [Myxococcota bacterium]